MEGHINVFFVPLHFQIASSATVCMVIKLDVRKKNFARSITLAARWPTFLVTLMLTRDRFAIANLVITFLPFLILQGSVRRGEVDSFYRATLCVCAVFAVAQCPSVRPSVCHVRAFYQDG